MKSYLTSLGLIFLLSVPAAAELCVEPDGFYRPCFGSAVVSSPKNTHVDMGGGGTAGSSNQDYLRYLAEKEEAEAEAAEAEAREKALEDLERDMTESASARAHARQQQSERQRINFRRRVDAGLRKQTEVEQRYRLEQQGFSKEAVDGAYGR
jgi:hypothetical protein